MDNMGKLLLSGNGKRNLLNIAAYIGISIAILAMYSLTLGMGYILLGLAVFLLLFVLYVVLSHSRRVKTEIQVYEDGVRGIGLTKGAFSPQAFQGSYHQIELDLKDKQAVTISTPQGKYSCYPANKRVIRTLVKEKMLRAKS